MQRPITYEYLRELFDYDDGAGVLIWKSRPIYMFRETSRSAYHNSTIWNGRYAGQPAGAANNKGYIHIKVDGRSLAAHRLIWLHQYGEPPSLSIDHIDGNKSNNRLSNLRQATRSQNAANTSCTKCNSSGFRGVVFNKQTNSYMARITKDGRSNYLGLFDTINEAKAAYERAAVMMYGEFARTS